MDHIPLWSDDLAHARVEIPYVCNDQFRYDDQGFLTYPHRIGVDTDVLAEDGHPILRLKDSAPFLQAWLWFGLLGEAIRVGSRHTTAPKRASSELFVKVIEDRKYLCTSRLQSIVSDHMMTSRAPLYRNWHLTRLSSCIQTATVFIRKALATLLPRNVAAGQGNIEDFPDILYLLLACQILCQTLLDRFDIASSPALRSPDILLPIETQPLDLVNSLLRQSGWCPREVERLPADVSFRYYLSFYRQKLACDSTRQKREVGCKCPHTEDVEFLPKHTHDQCRCAPITVSTSDIDSAVEAQKIVLCRFRHDTGSQRTLELRAVDIDGSIPYTAISHVRSAGLGNKLTNSLPFCQLSLLQSLADQLGGTGPAGGLFWIDTLCLPREMQLRKTALASAWDIFAGARHVLVLDPPLYQHAFCSAQEALIRIRYSSWKRRLWTLEEGFAAESLVFRFANRMVSLDELLNTFEKGFGDEMLKHMLWKMDPWDLKTCSRELIEQKLRRLLKHFIGDVSALSRRCKNAVISSWSNVDKLEVLLKLRLGFLAASRFRYFVEDDESRHIPLVWEILLKVYGGIEDQTKQGFIGGNKFEDSVSRLKEMSAVRIPPP